MRSMRQLSLVLFLLLALIVPAQANAASPPIGHVFIVMLENENASTTFGPNSPAPYLSKTLRNKGVFIPGYYGVTHLSLGNYVALVSGQGSNPQTQADCQAYNDFQLVGMGADGQALGQGCVYPTSVRTLANQLTATGFTWRGYMEDMGNDPTRESATCGHPPLNSPDPTQNASPTDQYAARHNPFVYFHSIIDNANYCAARDVPLSRLPGDLANGRVRNLSFITPDLCHDGHDATCADGGPGGLPAANDFLREWVPQIMKSQAFKQDGLLLITFDEAEAEGGQADATACCNEAQFPNTPNNGGPVQGRGGGRVGAVALSPFIAGGTTTTHAYNHFSTLRTIEGLFSLPFLGYANSPNPGSFGADVFNAP
jgi:phosphatidylinositol-3-phosphatase